MKKKEFKAKIKEAVKDTRLRINAHYILIGMATCKLIEDGETVTKRGLLEAVNALVGDVDEPLLEVAPRAMEHIHKLPTDSGVPDQIDANSPKIGIGDPVPESREDRKE